MKKFLFFVIAVFMVYFPVSCEQKESSFKVLFESELQSFDQQELAKLQEILKNYEIYNSAHKECFFVIDSGKQKKIVVDRMEFEGQEVSLKGADELRKEFLRKKFDEIVTHDIKAFKECPKCLDFRLVLENLHYRFDEKSLIASPESSAIVDDLIVNADASMIVLKPSESGKKSAEFTRLLLQESQECIQEIMNKK